MPKSQTSLDKFFAPTENASRNTQKIEVFIREIKSRVDCQLLLVSKMDFFLDSRFENAKQKRRQMMFIVQTLTRINVV